MVKLHVIRGEGGEPAKPEPGQPVAEIFLRTNLSTQQTDELRTALEQSGKGTFFSRTVAIDPPSWSPRSTISISCAATLPGPSTPGKSSRLMTSRLLRKSVAFAEEARVVAFVDVEMADETSGRAEGHTSATAGLFATVAQTAG
jgi:hypothetical protein